jgi:hypothetical protein
MPGLRSGCAGRVGGLGLGLARGQFAGEPFAGPVQPDAHRIARAVQDDRDLAVAQAFPGAEGQHLALGSWQPPVGLGNLGQLTGVLQRPVADREVGPQPAGQRRAAALAAMVISQHPAGRAVQPQPRVRAGGHVLQPPPGSQERLGQRISGVIRIVGAAQQVPEDRAVVRGVHRLETVRPLTAAGQ